jgi:hypothetical protein
MDVRPQYTTFRYHVAAATTAKFAAAALRFTILIFVVSGESRHGRASCSQCVVTAHWGGPDDLGPVRAGGWLNTLVPDTGKGGGGSTTFTSSTFNG